jgi:hypothetical protein
MPKATNWAIDLLPFDQGFYQHNKIAEYNALRRQY